MKKSRKTKAAARDCSWFLRELRSRAVADPSRAIRLDITEVEQPAAQAAFAVINDPGREATIDEGDFTAIRHMQARPVRVAGRRGWAMWRAEPMDPAARGTLERWTFFPPGFAWPHPVKRILVATVSEVTENPERDVGWEGREMQAKLQADYGPEYYIEMPGATAGADSTFPPGLYCDVWHGDDWLLVSRAEFYPAELAAAPDVLTRHADALQRRLADAPKLGAAAVRRENIVASLGSVPEGPIGDALRALDADALQVYQLRQAMNGDGRRNTWADVAAQFRSERKPGKRYTRARVQQIYRDALAAYPALSSYADALSARARQQFEDEDADADAIDAPGAYGTDGRIRAGAAFDLEELAHDREGGTRYRVTRDLRNREI
jgi:hypothetical protein